jgi:hypothetical protein
MNALNCVPSAFKDAVQHRPYATSGSSRPGRAVAGAIFLQDLDADVALENRGWQEVGTGDTAGAETAAGGLGLKTDHRL